MAADSATPTWYAVYFVRAFKPGEHWREDAPADDSDRKQHWEKGDLYTVGSVIADPLPAHLGYVEIPGPPAADQLWDRKKLAFVPKPPVVLDDPVAQELHDAGFTEAAKFIEAKAIAAKHDTKHAATHKSSK